MKVLVAYHSVTGNTEKLARAIYDALPEDKEIKPIKDIQGPIAYDLVFCGFPVQAHSVPRIPAEFIKSLPAGQNVAFFYTHGSLRGGQLPRQALEHAVGLAVKARILGQFGCRGRVSEKVMEALSGKPEHQAWVEEALGAMEHPDANDLEDGKNFTTEILVKFRDKKKGV